LKESASVVENLLAVVLLGLTRRFWNS